MTKRLYFVTFDIESSAGRNADYKKVENALKSSFGSANYNKVLKQCCVVRTKGAGAVTIRDVIRTTLGPQCNIAVLRLDRGFAIKIINRVNRALIEIGGGDREGGRISQFATPKMGN